MNACFRHSEWITQLKEKVADEVSYSNWEGKKQPIWQRVTKWFSFQTELVFWGDFQWLDQIVGSASASLGAGGFCYPARRGSNHRGKIPSKTQALTM